MHAGRVSEMRYFLDTDICIFALKGAQPRIEERLRGLSPAEIRIATIVRAELLLGVLLSKSPSRTGDAVQRFLAPFEVVPFGAASADAYARIRHSLEKKGQPIGPNDLILAATVLSQGGCLVTHNLKEFRRVEGLHVEDWTA